MIDFEQKSDCRQILFPESRFRGEHLFEFLLTFYIERKSCGDYWQIYHLVFDESLGGHNASGTPMIYYVNVNAALCVV